MEHSNQLEIFTPLGRDIHSIGPVHEIPKKLFSSSQVGNPEKVQYACQFGEKFLPQPHTIYFIRPLPGKLP